MEDIAKNHPTGRFQILKAAWQKFDYLSEEEYSADNSNYLDVYTDHDDLTGDEDYEDQDDSYFNGDHTNQESEFEIKNQTGSKLTQGLLLFLKSYGVGLAIGILLIFLYWLIYIRG